MVLPRLLIGLVVLIGAEVFSGASIQVGLWSPWTWVVTYWLYFAHFFFITTLAVRTRRTSVWSLYLWGVLFGLYVPVVINFLVWTPLGLILTALSLLRGTREPSSPSAEPSLRALSR